LKTVSKLADDHHIIWRFSKMFCLFS